MPEEINPVLKDVRVEVRVRNNLILSRMEHRGIKSVAELARQMSIDQRVLGELVNMTRAARNEDGKWHGLAYKLADFFDCAPQDLFSEFQQDIVLEKNKSYAELAYTEMQQLTTRRQEPITPELEYQAKQLRNAINEALQTLTPREQRIIRLRFGFDSGEELTLEQIGELFGLTGNRIRQIEERVLRKLKHPDRASTFFATAGFTEKVKSSWSEELVEVQHLDDDVLKSL